MKDEGADHLAKALLFRSQLRRIWLDQCEIKKLSAAGVGSLIAQPAGALEEISLSQNLIDDEGAAVLAKGLAQHEGGKLAVLSLSQNKIKDKGLGALADALHTNKTVSLRVSGNGPITEGLRMILAREHKERIYLG